MSRKLIWSAQLFIVVLCALALKFYYSTATPDELLWILAPTTKLVQLFSGRSFAFESLAGYMSSDRRFVIAVSCAGVNFLLTSFLLLALGRLWRERFQAVSWWFIPVSVAVAYVTTLIANTVRICIALEIQRQEFAVSWLTGNQLHRLEGIVVYFGFLLLLFLLTERSHAPQPARMPRVLLFPLLVYYATTFAIPLVNGSYRQQAFWEHSAFVLLLPLVLMMPLLAYAILLQIQKNRCRKNNAVSSIALSEIR